MRLSTLTASRAPAPKPEAAAWPAGGERRLEPPRRGEPVAAEARAVLEPGLGHSFEGVRIFADAEADRSARALDASAYTVGEDVFFAQGRYDPRSAPGLRLLGHELVHAVQQRGAEGPPAGFAGEAQEREASTATARAMAGLPARVAAGGGPAAVAREKKEETEAERAQMMAGQFPWMRALLPNWTVDVGRGGLAATKTDGMTTLTRTADVGLADGGSASVGQRRVTEVDKDHAMESEHKAGYADGAGFLSWMSGGRSLADDGTVVADQRRREISAGPSGVAVKASSSATRDTVTTSSSTEAAVKDGGWSVAHERGREFKLDDDNMLTSGIGARVGSEGASVSRTTGSRIKDIDTGAVEATGRSFSAGYDANKGISGSYGRQQSTEVDGKTFATGTGLAVSGEGVDITRTRSQSETDAEGNKSGTSSSTGVKLGPGGVAVTRSTTDAKGNTTAVAVGGDMAFDQHGNPTKLKVNAGVTRNGKSVSVSGGYEVHASEPREEGGRWVVDWERKLTAGGKGGAKGVSASAEYQSSQFGSRSFKSQTEAVTFQENAATMLPSASHDPSTVAGAMHLEIGEMRGASEGTTLGASAAISPTAGSIGAGAQRSSSSGVKVRRLSPAVFELTKEHGTAGGESLSASTLGAGATGHRERDETASTTIRVDLTTPEGKAAFERFSQSGEVGPGARVVSSSVVKGEQSGTTVSMPGFSHDRTGRTEEELTYDEQGKKERYSGIASESISSSIPWAKGHDNSSMRIDSTELNDRQSYYSITGSVDSTEGRKSFEHLAQMTGTVTRDASNAKSSGKWGVEVEITEEIVNAFLARVGSEEVRQAGIFDQTSRNQLRERLRDAKTSDDRKRALAQFFAEGQEGKGIQAVRDTIFGVRNEWAMSTDYEMMKSNKGGNFNYDLTLPGDRNFRGAAARLELEAKIKQLQQLVQDNPAAAGTLHGTIYETLNEVRRMRGEIGDPKRYTDLPDELRENQVARLDTYIGTLKALAEQAGVAMTEADVPEPDAAPAPGRKGARKPAAPADPLKVLRGKIGTTDKALAEAKKRFQDSAEAYGRYLKAANRQIHGDFPPEIRDALQLERTANQLKASVAPADDGVTELRSRYLESLADPDAAQATGAGLLGQLTVQKEGWAAAAAKMGEAEAEVLSVVDVSGL